MIMAKDKNIGILHTNECDIFTEKDVRIDE